MQYQRRGIGSSNKKLIAAGVKPASANKEDKATMSQNLYMIVEAVADRFKLSPFEVMEKYLDEVLTVWTGAIISAQDKKSDKKVKQDNEEERVRVTSKTATWH